MSYFIVSITYKVPLKTVDHHLPAHIDFLDRYFEKGIFLFAGPQVPRAGGIIFAKAETKEQLEKILTEDPFHTEDVANFEVTEMNPRKYHPDLKTLFSPSS